MYVIIHLMTKKNMQCVVFGVVLASETSAFSFCQGRGMSLCDT